MTACTARAHKLHRVRCRYAARARAEREEHAQKAIEEREREEEQKRQEAAEKAAAAAEAKAAADELKSAAAVRKAATKKATKKAAEEAEGGASGDGEGGGDEDGGEGGGGGDGGSGEGGCGEGDEDGGSEGGGGGEGGGASRLPPDVSDTSGAAVRAVFEKFDRDHSGDIGMRPAASESGCSHALWCPRLSARRPALGLTPLASIRGGFRRDRAPRGSQCPRHADERRGGGRDARALRRRPLRSDRVW